MSTAVKTTEQDVLSAGPEALLQHAERAVASADKVLQAAKAGVRAKVAEAGGIDNAQHRRARPRLARHRRRGSAPDARVGHAPQRRRPFRRVRAADPRGRFRRVPGADRRRHPDEPARDRAPRGAGRAACRRAPLRGRGRRPDRGRQHAGDQGAPRRLSSLPSPTPPPSAIRVSTRRMRRSTTRCASSPRPRWCRTRTSGTSRTTTSRSK